MMFEKISIIGCGLIGSSILRNINKIQKINCDDFQGFFNTNQ